MQCKPLPALILFLVFISCAGCQNQSGFNDQVTFPEGASEVRIHFEQANGTLLTDQVRINGRNIGWFIIDTGANVTFIDRGVWEKSGLAQEQPRPHSGSFDSPDGDYIVNTLSLAGMALRNRNIGVSDLATTMDRFHVPMAGVLGGDIWSAEPFTIDFRESTIVLHRRADFHPPAGAESCALMVAGGATRLDTGTSEITLVAGQPTVSGIINHAGAAILLDTGSGQSMALKPGLMRQHPEWQDPDMRRPLRAAVVGGDFVGAKINEFTLFGKDFGHVDDAIGMTGTWRSSGMISEEAAKHYAGSSEAVIGTPILSDFRLTFDYAKAKLWAEYRPRPTVAERLAAGMDPNALDLANETPLMRAVKENRNADVAALLKAGARLDVHGRKGLTALHFVAAFGTPDMLDTLLATNQKVDINVPAETGASPLFLAVALGNQPVVTKLLAMGANPDNEENGWSVLQIAVRSGHLAACQALLKAGAKLPGDGKLTLLLLAAANGKVPMIRYLLEHGNGRANLESLDSDGLTPFLTAVDNNKLEAAKTLLEAGANPAARSTKGESALDLANHNADSGQDVIAMKTLLAKE